MRLGLDVDGAVVRAHLGDGRLGKLAVDDRDAHAGFFEDLAVLEDAGHAAAAAGAGPLVAAEGGAVELGEGGDDLFLLFFYEGFHAEAHGGGGGYGGGLLFVFVAGGEGGDVEVDWVEGCLFLGGSVRGWRVGEGGRRAGEGGGGMFVACRFAWE